MPREITSKEEFAEMLDKAIEVRMVRFDDGAKLKIRTHEKLFTFRTTVEVAESLTKGLKIPVREIGQKK